MKHIDQLESEWKLNINVSGSIERQSDNSHPRQIKIKIFNGHVQYVYKDENNFKFLYSKYKPYTKWKKRHYPIYFKKNYEDNTVKLCKLLTSTDFESIDTSTEPISYLDEFHKLDLNFSYFLKQVPKRKKKRYKLSSRARRYNRRRN